MNSINTNIGALAAQKAMNEVTREMDQAMTRLSTGLRINSAKDDAAGSAIATRMESTVRSLGVAIRNGGDAISTTQTAEGALGEMSNILQRMRELSVQASNSTLNGTDRASIQKEVDALTVEIDNIANNTNFNGVKLLNGQTAEVNFQLGINENNGLLIGLDSATSTALGLNSYSTSDGSLASGRVSAYNYNTGGQNLLAGDIKINGKDALAATLSTDQSTDASDALKTAINANSSVHCAIATAYNTVTGNAFEDEAISMTIESVALVSTGGKDLVNQINEKVAGVTAKMNDNGTITLSNTTGNDIAIGHAKAGFEATTYTGFLKLKNIDATAVTVQTNTKSNGFAADTGTIADVQRFGFNETDKAGSYEGKAVDANAITTDDTITVNGIKIGKSTDASATSKASAINAVTSETSVTATAFTQVDLSLDFTKARNASKNEAVGFSLAGWTSAATEYLSFSDGVNTYKAVHNTDSDTTAAALVNAINASHHYTASYTAATDKFVITAGETSVADTGQTFSNFGVTKANISMTRGGELEVDTYTLSTTGTLLDTVGESVKISDGVTDVIVDLKDADTASQDTKAEVLALFAAAINNNFAAVTATVSTDDIVITSKTPGTALSAFTMQSINATTTTVVAGTEKTAAAADVHETHLIDVSGATIGTGDFMEFRDDGQGTDISVAFAGSISATADALVAAINANATYSADYTAFNASGKITLVATTSNNDIGAAGTLDVDINVAGPLLSATKADTNANVSATAVAQDASQAVTAVTPAISINGVSLNVSDDNSIDTLVTEINGKSLGDIVAASTTEGKLRLTSASGADITIIDDDTTANATTGFITAGTDNYGAVIETSAFSTEIDDAGITVKGRIQLDSADNSPVVVDGATASLTKIGLVATGGTELKAGSGLSVSNTVNASSAITSIDAAIDKITSFKSNYGAIENRIQASISNLETLKLNTEAAKSRIEDADFASETSSLTKSQILSQAATTMLAQANASKQNLLALLQG